MGQERKSLVWKSMNHSMHGTGRTHYAYADGVAHIRIECPGVPKEYITVEAVGDRLKVSIDNKGDGPESLYARSSEFLMQEYVDSEAITSRLSDGVLYVEAPVKTPSRRLVQIS